MKAFVLLSGGIDSTTCLYLANKEFGGQVVGLSINYGQRHSKEIEYARKSCAALGVLHTSIDLSGVVPKTMLTDAEAAVPSISYADIKGVSPTYVPFRNGLLLSSITSYVHGQLLKAPGDADEWGIYFGAHAEDARLCKLIRESIKRLNDLAASCGLFFAPSSLSVSYPKKRRFPVVYQRAPAGPCNMGCNIGAT